MKNFIDRARTAHATQYCAALLLLLGQGCAGREGGGSAPETTTETAEAIQGPTSFVSADDFVDVWGEEEEEEEEEVMPEGGGLAFDAPMQAQGDIYQPLGGGHLLDLNPWRGLQVIDVHDPSNPHIVGRLPIAGSPIQMHVQGNRVLAVLNDGYGYRRDAERLAAQNVTGATILQIDVTDRHAPKVLSRTGVSGRIRASLYEGGALYVGTTAWGWFPVPGTGYYEGRNQTLIRRFDVTGSAPVLTSTADITGELRGLSRSGSTLVALHSDNGGGSPTTEVSLLDIAPGGGISVRGKVSLGPNIPGVAHVDLRGNILRVFSGPKWDTAGLGSHLGTWDASAPGNPVPIDQKDFAPGGTIHGALFTDDRAYVSTSLLNPGTFRTFGIDPTGHITELGAFAAPGIEDHLRPVLGGSRLLSISQSAPSYYRLGVNLYDPQSPQSPLLAHAEVLPYSYDYPAPPEVSYEPRAFTVLENEVNVQAPGGPTETGLLLLPYNSGDFSNVPYTAGVQLFTFSSSTVTRRGFLALNSPMRRGFPTQGDGAAGLSDRELGLYDRSDVDDPTAQGHLFLAPSFAAILRYGDYRVRVRSPEDTGYWGRQNAHAYAEIIPRAGEAQDAPTLARIEVPLGAHYYKVGDLLAAVRMTNWSEVTITTFDLADPLHPQAKGDFVTKALPSNYYRLPDVHVTNHSLAFLYAEENPTYLGDYDECWYVPQDSFSPCYGQEGCVYWTGERRCQAPTGQPLGCDGGFAQCTYHVGADPTCVPVDLAQAQPHISGGCYTGTATRTVRQATVGVVDLSNPASPTVSPVLTFGAPDDFVSAFSDGHDLHVTVKQAATVAGDARPYARYFDRRIDLSQPGQPVVSPGINVPGVAVAASDGKLITRDVIWGDHFKEGAVARVEVQNGLAQLKNYQRFPDREVNAVVVVDGLRPVVAHGLGWKPGFVNYEVPVPWDPRARLSLLKPSGGPGVKGFDVRAESLLAPWMSLSGAQGNIAFLGVPGGTITVKTGGNELKVRDFFYTQGWVDPAEAWIEVYPAFLVDEDDVLIANGRYGILQSGDLLRLPAGP